MITITTLQNVVAAKSSVEDNCLWGFTTHEALYKCTFTFTTLSGAQMWYLQRIASGFNMALKRESSVALCQIYPKVLAHIILTILTKYGVCGFITAVVRSLMLPTNCAAV